ncbi:polysaccharide deacetylase family protein [Flavobacterium sp. XGLA_31]|uniref:polysaccharide deacetylase family protein n=1 Tax=Flavobacterium sp. XGLA_31 TaxID=3447666 RepID=UPI003F3E71FF
MKKNLLVFIVTMLLLPLGLRSQYTAITNYRKYFATAVYNGMEVAVIRAYSSQERQYYIAVGVNDIQTYLIPAEKIRPVTQKWDELVTLYSKTPYIKAIRFAKRQSFSIQDAGIQHGYSKNKGIALTIDLCPSHKTLDRIIFTSIAEAFKNLRTPKPIGVSITGKFLNTHPEDIEWLKGMVKSGAIDIVWINHTYNHRYNPKLPLKENFLLEPQTNLDTEILLLEQRLLEKEIVCSVFFRFPGLVSDRNLVEQVTNYGLIPIGSDAWLAKGQSVQNGDIVLIHGNGNEPVGVTDFLALLKKKQSAILKKEWLLYDLREAIDEEFKND